MTDNTSARTDGDSWDLASGVGATATAVAAGRAVASQGIEFKTRTLTDLGVAPATERRTVGIDLRDDWPTALREQGFDANLPTAWIAEGLLPYLPPAAQDRLFDDITALSAPGSRLATEQMDLNSLPDDWADKLNESTRRAGSGLNLTELLYSGDRASAAEYLPSHGWNVPVISTQEAFAANGFQLPDDELTGLIRSSGHLSAVLG